MKCYDRLSGERFEVSGEDPVSEIERYIREGIDSDTGRVGYEVECDDGTYYEGEVDPE